MAVQAVTDVTWLKCHCCSFILLKTSFACSCSFNGVYLWLCLARYICRTRLTFAEVSELSGCVGRLVVVHLIHTTYRAGAQTGHSVSVSLLTLFLSLSVIDSRGVPHRQVHVSIGQHHDKSHGGLHLVSVGSKTGRVIGQAHPVPLPCKLNTHKMRCE